MKVAYLDLPLEMSISNFNRSFISKIHRKMNGIPKSSKMGVAWEMFPLMGEIWANLNPNFGFGNTFPQLSKLNPL